MQEFQRNPTKGINIIYILLYAECKPGIDYTMYNFFEYTKTYTLYNNKLWLKKLFFHSLFVTINIKLYANKLL